MGDAEPGEPSGTAALDGVKVGVAVTCKTQSLNSSKRYSKDSNIRIGSRGRPIAVAPLLVIHRRRRGV